MLACSGPSGNERHGPIRRTATPEHLFAASHRRALCRLTPSPRPDLPARAQRLLLDYMDKALRRSFDEVTSDIDSIYITADGRYQGPLNDAKREAIRRFLERMYVFDGVVVVPSIIDLLRNLAAV